MPIFSKSVPLSLYIHIPWCVRKCPYCDFNSHEAKSTLPEEIYVNALLQELDMHLPLIDNRPLISIFFGGGTPSLFSAHAISRILDGVSKKLRLSKDIEITLEANPGTIDQSRFKEFRAAGINRLSIGVQSLQDEKLKALGRIHDHQAAAMAIQLAKEAGFDNFNIDIMYGLPNQSVEEALTDLKTALAFGPTHFSWYQLTIEPNTFFAHQPPSVPADDIVWDMQLAGMDLLQAQGYQQYEVSAYAQPGKTCQHNLNYWEFGDYLGIGAGAHSKITRSSTQQAIRFSQVRHPKDYLDPAKRNALAVHVLNPSDLTFEFMLNALRLTNGFPIAYFEERTGLHLDHITNILKQATQDGLLRIDATHIKPTALGMKFLNNLTALFLAD